MMRDVDDLRIHCGEFTRRVRRNPLRPFDIADPVCRSRRYRDANLGERGITSFAPEQDAGLRDRLTVRRDQHIDNPSAGHRRLLADEKNVFRLTGASDNNDTIASEIRKRPHRAVAVLSACLRLAQEGKRLHRKMRTAVREFKQRQRAAEI
jgi:hypothetical protein